MQSGNLNLVQGYSRYLQYIRTAFPSLPAPSYNDWYFTHIHGGANQIPERYLQQTMASSSQGSTASQGSTEIGQEDLPSISGSDSKQNYWDRAQTDALIEIWKLSFHQIENPSKHTMAWKQIKDVANQVSSLIL